MKKIIMFDTSYGTQNLGDFIINSSINKELNFILDHSFVTRFSTHNPLLKTMQNNQHNQITKICSGADIKFLCGTNLFKNNLLKINSDFNVGLFDIKNYKNCISVGCGCTSSINNMNAYTRLLYKKILSKEYIHSTRDEKTKQFIENMGFKAINTGCASMWMLGKEHCMSIPKNKSNRVVFTLTDYNQDRKNDQLLIDTLVENYEQVYFWIQGSNDYNYFHSFRNIENVNILNPNLFSFESLLKEGNVDYVGTRLHAGIYALQHFIRSIIIIVDNRARDIRDSYSIPSIERAELEDGLKKMIDSEFSTSINIDENSIFLWKKQFMKDEQNG